MKNKYFEIMGETPGIDELKTVINKWYRFSKNGNYKNNAYHGMLPEMLWILQPGVNVTRLLYLLTEGLAEDKMILEFSGDCKFIEFSCDYNGQAQVFPELKRLHETIRHTAGRKSEYRGVIYIDISKWIGHEHEEYFSDLLTYLANECRKSIIILSLCPGKDDDTRAIEQAVLEHFRTEKVTFEAPQMDSLTTYFGIELSRQKFDIENKALDIITQSIEALRDNDRLNGYKTIGQLCTDMIYTAIASEKPCNVITEEIASKFSKDSEYIQTRIYKHKSENIIGFGGALYER